MELQLPATCHMGSHSVTCHLTQVNSPRLNLTHTSQYSTDLPQRDGRLSWPRWLVSYLDGISVCRSHPSTNPAMHGRELNSQPVDHKSDALTITRLLLVEIGKLVWTFAKWSRMTFQAGCRSCHPANTIQALKNEVTYLTHHSNHRQTLMPV